MKQYQELSEKQLSILNFIKDYVSDNGISPTIEDVKIGCQLSSKSVVSYNLNILEKNGYLDRKKGLARSIKSTKDYENEEIIEIPIVSNISAGTPLELYSSDEIYHNQKNSYESIKLSKKMYKNKTNLIALKISGDSMKEDAIMDGDIIILDCNNVSTNDIKNGDIVAARVDEDAGTLKRIFLKNNKIELRPSNKHYSSIFTDKTNVRLSKFDKMCQDKPMLLILQENDDTLTARACVPESHLQKFKEGDAYTWLHTSIRRLLDDSTLMHKSTKKIEIKPPSGKDWRLVATMPRIKLASKSNEQKLKVISTIIESANEFANNTWSWFINKCLILKFVKGIS